MSNGAFGAAPLDLSARDRRLVLIGTMLGLLVSATNQTVVTTALPRIVGELGGLNLFSWVFTSFMLTSTTVVPLSGKLSDMFGRKPFFLGGIVIMMVASAGGGTSQSIEQLIIWRGIQGIGAGMLMGNAFAIIGDMFPPAERGKYQGLFTGVFGVASVLGPTLGGTLTDAFSWRAVFYINIPFGLAAFAMLWKVYPVRARSGEKALIDYSGVALLIGSVVPLLLALSWAGDEYAWTSLEILSMLAFSAVCLVGFIWNESRAAEPIIPLTLFNSRFFAVATVLSFVSGMGLFGVINYMPMFVQGVLGTSAAQSGFVTSPMMLGMVVSSTLAGILATRTGRYRAFIISGSAMITGGMVLLTGLTTASSALAVVGSMVVIGIGIGLSMPIVNLVLQNSVSHNLLGVVSSSSQFFRQIGGTLGTAVFGTLVATNLQNNLERELSQDIVEQTPPPLMTDLQEPQTLLSPAALDRLEAGYAALGPQGAELFQRSLDAMRLALADALGIVFLAAVFVTGIGLAVSLLMPEPKGGLRRSWSEAPDDEREAAAAEARLERQEAVR
jgi:EmrB/QacA subfamily drug resistance transporter